MISAFRSVTPTLSRAAVTFVVSKFDRTGTGFDFSLSLDSTVCSSLMHSSGEALNGSQIKN